MWIARAMAGATVLLWAASYLWSKTLLTWLDPSANPRITIGVGDPALLPTTS